ncbi:hypothetical protein LINGRAHAP2_LOCUS4749 [Linum grandiflorum]
MSMREFVSSYLQGNYGAVRLGNDNLSKVVGKGDVYLETMDGVRLLLRDVRHVPDMRLNLIFVDKHHGEGYCHNFNNG